MGRLVAFNALFFLLPFAIYAGWLLVTRGSAGNPAYWPLRTIGFLALGGALVTIAALVTLPLMTRRGSMTVTTFPPTARAARWSPS